LAPLRTARNSKNTTTAAGGVAPAERPNLFQGD
jgi:hypothetical protein